MPSAHAADSTPARARKDRLSDVGIALGAFAASLGLLALGDSDLGGDARGIQTLAVVLTGLASLPLVARRRAPLAVFVLTALASTVLRAIAVPGGPPIGPTVALYGVAASGDGSRARTRVTLALVVALLVAHATVSGLANGHFPALELLFGALLWGGTWLAGDRTRLRLERMDELEERALRAEREADRERRLVAAEERMRIARDLHDSAGHAINVILVHAGLGRLHVERDPERARQALETIEEVARDTVGEIDQLVGVLRVDGSLRSGEGEVEPPPGVAALEELVERHRAAGMDVRTTISGERRSLSPGVDQGAYRILQEALTNAARHGDGRADVGLTFGASELDLTVANGVSGDGLPRKADGHGVTGMRERAALLGVTLEVAALNGHFRVHARLPVAGHRG